MAGTVTGRSSELAGFRAEKGCAISLYLNLDPRCPDRGDANRMNSMLHAPTDRWTDPDHEQRMG
jgi:hypothetical protein